MMANKFYPLKAWLTAIFINFLCICLLAQYSYISRFGGS